MKKQIKTGQAIVGMSVEFSVVELTYLQQKKEELKRLIESTKVSPDSGFVKMSKEMIIFLSNILRGIEIDLSSPFNELVDSTDANLVTTPVADEVISTAKKLSKLKDKLVNQRIATPSVEKKLNDEENIFH